MFKVFLMIKVINCFILLQNHISILIKSDSNVILNFIFWKQLSEWRDPIYRTGGTLQPHSRPYYDEAKISSSMVGSHFH